MSTVPHDLEFFSIDLDDKSLLIKSETLSAVTCVQKQGGC